MISVDNFKYYLIISFLNSTGGGFTEGQCEGDIASREENKATGRDNQNGKYEE